MRVAFLPVYPNPYQRLLEGGLTAHGVAVTKLPRLPSREWLRENRPTTDILHYHWLSGLYMARLATPRQALAFLRHLREARALGYRLVWTAHNILPHRAGLRPLHVAMRRRIMTEADAVIVHCHAGRDELLARFPRRGPTVVIPHGNYRGEYPVAADRAALRVGLGLSPSAFVYLSLGNIAAYKGLENYVNVFGSVAGPDDVALIAGRNRDESVVRRLARVAADDRRIRLDVGFVTDARMGAYLTAADALVAPFTEILTSGSVVAALSYGLPVVVPGLGCLPELVGEAGIVYAAGDGAALGRALVDIKAADRVHMADCARAIADGLRWDDIGGQTAGVYRLVVEDMREGAPRV